MYFELNLAVIIRSDTWFQSNKLSAVSLFSNNATPLWWTLSSLPEYSIVSPVAVLNLPKPDHLHSLMPSTLTRYFFASATIWAVFPTLIIVLTFQHPIRMLFVGVANDAFGAQAPSWFWPMLVTLSASHLTKSSSGVWHVTVLLPRYSKTSFEKNCFSAWASTLNMGLINKVDMVCLSPVGYGV